MLLKPAAFFLRRIRGNLETVLLALAATYACIHLYLGPMMAGFTLTMLFYHGGNLFLSRHEPPKVSHHLCGIVIVLLASGIVLTVHTYYAFDARQTANTVVNTISTFKKKHSTYPTTLTDIHADIAVTAAIPYKIHYKLDENGYPALQYPRTYDPYNFWHYDFITSEWQPNSRSKQQTGSVK